MCSVPLCLCGKRSGLVYFTLTAHKTDGNQYDEYTK
jgi:hypothetical protein